MKKLLVSIISIFLISMGFAYGQASHELAFRASILNTGDLGVAAPKARRRFNPVRGLFNFYKKNISDQIINDCIYEVSCSEFSKDVFENYGAVKGIFLTCDRLSRCNRLSYEEMPRERVNASGKIIDRWEDYKFVK